MKLLQFQARENIEHLLQQQLPDDELTVFENPQSLPGFVWEEAGEEFHYEGEMYDVVREKQEHGKILVYCVDDRKESKIYSCLEGLVNRQLADNNTTTGAVHHYLIRLLTQVYVLTGGQQFAFLLQEKSTHFLGDYTADYPQLFLDIASPPPKSS